MKTFNYTKTSFTPANNISYNFRSNNTDYSKMLDDLIYADIADKNAYLFATTPKTKSDIYLDKIIDSNKYKTTDLTSAIKLITTNGKLNKNLPYTIGETYYTDDGTPIIFYEDSIQIGFDLYYFYELNKPIFIKNITPKAKKKILDIYINGLKISILK